MSALSTQEALGRVQYDLLLSVASQSTHNSPDRARRLFPVCGNGTAISSRRVIRSEGPLPRRLAQCAEGFEMVKFPEDRCVVYHISVRVNLRGRRDIPWELLPDRPARTQFLASGRILEYHHSREDSSSTAVQSSLTSFTPRSCMGVVLGLSVLIPDAFHWQRGAGSPRCIS
ncbi:hypothetical protein BV20DRAFT_96732 [Pilatotrama ljubarskyi]|nr:hypothetical protein BV20DRAFT_96732 [Pilatotrama ljubarskyi]